MKITQKKFKDAQLFFIDGIFNYEAIREIESIFEKQKDSTRGDIYMDLTKTVNIDSLAIGYLVKLNRKMKKYGRILFLTNLNEHIQKIFRLTNMDKYFKIMQNFNDKDFFH